MDLVNLLLLLAALAPAFLLMGVVTGPVAVSEKFAAACTPVIGSNYDTCGTVTRATIDHLSVDDLNALFAPGGLYADLDAWFVHSIEMKACGVRRYVLYDWIWANADRGFRAALTGMKANKGPSLLHPFIMGRQMSVVNRGHYKLTNGWATGDYTPSPNGSETGPLTAAQIALAPMTTNASKRIIRVEPRHDIPADANWFRSRDIIHIFSRTGGVLEHGTWRTIAAAASDDLTYIDVVVENENTGSSEPYLATPGASSTTGYIIPGRNNVNDFEAWCHNLPNINPNKMVPFWYQTSRMSRCVDSEYQKVYRRLLDSNPAFRQFQSLDMAERNRQDELEDMMRFVNDFFYNKPIGPNQTLSLWENLQSIETPNGAGLITGINGKLIAKRANFIGVREQLRVCDRVIDHQNQKLNFKEWLRDNYNLMRARETTAGGSRRVTRIDWWTSSQYRAVLFDAFLKYYEETYRGMLRINLDLHVKRDQLNENLGVSFDVYKVKWPSGLEIAILSDEYFDDRRTEFDATVGSGDGGSESAGNLLLALDIGKPGPNGGSIYWAPIASNRRVHKTADLQQLAAVDETFRCVMDVISIQQTLQSDTGTAVVECPLHSRWIENFTDELPDTVSETAPYTNLY